MKSIQKNVELELQNYVEDLELINKLNTATFEGKDLRDICILASDDIRKIFSSFGSTVYSLNETHDLLSMVNSSFSVAMRRNIEKFLKSDIPSPALSLKTESSYKKVITTGKSLLITSSEKIESFIHEAGSAAIFGEKRPKKFYLKLIPGIIRLLKIKSITLIPLISEKKIWGIISISSRNILSEFDLSRLENISNQLALILNRKTLQNNLKKAKIAAESSDKLKSIFLANMSHEIRTPLNSIIGFTDLVLDDIDLSETNREFLQNSKDSGRILLNLINDILDLSKIEAGQITISESETPIFELMDAVGERVNILLKGKKENIDVRKSYQTNIADIIKCDNFRLEQILNNLLGNAAKFTESGYIEYGFTQRNEMLEFYVRDTGLGIPKEKQGHIFEPFIQADSEIAVKFGGTGLGLTITKKLVELMGGSINFISKTEVGSTFYFTIPYKPCRCDNKNSSTQLNNPVRTEGKKRKILVVEDDRINQRLVEAILEKNDFSLVSSENGRDAVSKYKTDRSIDLILMDMHLPLLNGIEATKIIRQIQETEKRDHVPIVALTANAMKGDKEKFIQSGCDSFLTKPLDISTLLETINRLLE